jgi:CO/xanthine dehydrogenase FAD-binding subunit
MSAAPVEAYAGATSLAGALRVRAEHPKWLVLAGGTDVMAPGSGLADPPGVLDVFGVDELHGVDGAAEVIRIGACTTYAELLASDVVRDSLPLLAGAAREVGAEQIRERGTIGGNVVTCSPVGDMLGTVQHWRKVGTRSAQAITKVALAAVARVDAGRVAHFRLAFGAVADHPVRLHAVEALVEGQIADLALADAVGAAVRDALQPITDARSTADYRRDVAARLATRFVAGL